MDKIYFFSYEIYKDGVKTKFGHGSTTVGEDSDLGYELTMSNIKKDLDDKDVVIHLIAFNRVD